MRFNEKPSRHPRKAIKCIMRKFRQEKVIFIAICVWSGQGMVKVVNLTHLDMCVDYVLAAASPRPLSWRHLLDFRRFPIRIDSLGVVPKEYESVAFDNRIGCHLGRVRNWGGNLKNSDQSATTKCQWCLLFIYKTPDGGVYARTRYALIALTIYIQWPLKAGTKCKWRPGQIFTLRKTFAWKPHIKNYNVHDPLNYTQKRLITLTPCCNIFKLNEKPWLK